MGCVKDEALDIRSKLQLAGSCRQRAASDHRPRLLSPMAPPRPPALTCSRSFMYTPASCAFHHDVAKTNAWEQHGPLLPFTPRAARWPWPLVPAQSLTRSPWTRRHQSAGALSAAVGDLKPAVRPQGAPLPPLPPQPSAAAVHRHVVVPTPQLTDIGHNRMLPSQPTQCESAGWRPRLDAIHVDLPFREELQVPRHGPVAEQHDAPGGRQVLTRSTTQRLRLRMRGKGASMIPSRFASGSMSTTQPGDRASVPSQRTSLKTPRGLEMAHSRGPRRVTRRRQSQLLESGRELMLMCKWQGMMPPDPLQPVLASPSPRPNVHCVHSHRPRLTTTREYDPGVRRLARVRSVWCPSARALPLLRHIRLPTHGSSLISLHGPGIDPLLGPTICTSVQLADGRREGQVLHAEAAEG